MKRNIGKFIRMLFILTICLALFSPMAMAAKNEKARIPVRISLSGSPPEVKEDYEIVLRADDMIYPMPDNSVDGVFTMNILGEGSKNLPEIKFSSLGVYKYTIFQKVGENELATYDDSIYNLVIYVTNAEIGDGYDITNLLYKDGNTNKYDELVFNNEYKKIVEPEKEDPPDDKKLPKTGQASSGLYFLIGGMFITTGFLLRRKKE